MTRMGKVIIAMSKFIAKPMEDCGGEVDYRHIQLEGVEGFDFVTTIYFPLGSDQYSSFEEAFQFYPFFNVLMYSYSNVFMTVKQFSNSALVIFRIVH